MAAILVFFCLLENEPLLPCLRENILLNFEFKNEATRANLQVNKRILKWRPFWNKVYCNNCNAFFGVEHPLKFSAYFLFFSDGFPLEKKRNKKKS